MAKRQPELPGCEREVITSLERVVEDFLEAKELTAGARERERLALDELLGTLAAHELQSYSYVDGEFLFVVRAVDERKIKVTKIQGRPEVGNDA